MVRRRIHTAVTGKNGSGKSTLLRTIYGLHAPAIGGTITRFGIPEHSPLEEAQREMGFASAELQSSICRDDSLLEVIFSAQRPADSFTQEQVFRAEELILRLSIGAPSNRCFGDLSYGQQRKTVLARALVHRPQILLLDEPMSGLDADSRERLADLLEEEAERGSTIITAIHHAEDILPFTRRIIALENGRIISSGE
jgi:ABC-type molybdenum transport system ATPase subunit/photorepair protein PhrA